MNLEDNPSYEVTALTIPADQMDAAGAEDRCIYAGRTKNRSV